MEYFPVFIDLKDKPCLVVGGGNVAERKVRLLLKVGARVHVIAPTLNGELSRWFADGSVTAEKRAYVETDMNQRALVFAATDEAQTNQKVYRHARQKNIWVNVADDPAHCQFIIPSIVDRGTVVIAASTSGQSPTLARHLRKQLEEVLPENIGGLADWLGQHRETVRMAISDEQSRRHFWDKLLNSPAVEYVLSNSPDKADQYLNAMLAGNTQQATGEVYLVGAGPGDPELLTLRALRLMQQADVVLFDRLVSEEVLDKVRRDAERLYVGKKRDFHAVRQEEINQMIVTLAKQGKRVLRLKGGDPFIFGRGGEEIATLCEEGIPFQVVPGITAASGCAAYAGIPLTHRDYAQSVTFVTGNRKNGQLDLDWQRLVRPEQTIAVYMGLAGVEELFGRLIRHGLAENMPAALIEQGTSWQQRVITGTAGTLPDQVKAMHVQAPTLIIIGQVVTLHDSLKWREEQAQ